MPTRRTAMVVIGAIALRITLPRFIRDACAQSGEQAVGFVRSTSEQLAAIVDSSDLPQEMRDRLKDVIIDSTVDVDDVARFCLGRFWHLATPDQQKQYLALFHKLLVIKIADHLGEFKGVQVSVGLARRSADTEIVTTIVQRTENRDSSSGLGCQHCDRRPKDCRFACGWHQSPINPKRRFHSHLTHNNYSIQDLIDAMRQMLARTRNVRR